MTTRSITNKITLSTDVGAVTRLITSGLTSEDEIICEDIPGWNTGDTIRQDVRQATFPTKDLAGVHLGATYAPKTDLSLVLVYTNTDTAIAHVNTLNQRDITSRLYLQVVNDVTPVEGFEVWYSGFQFDEFWNEGCRLVLRFTTAQALPVQY